MSEYNYGVNLLLLLNELAQYEAYELMDGEFEIAVELDSGVEGFATVEIPKLAEDAAKTITALKQKLDALAAENALIHSTPSLSAMMSALDAFYEHEDLPETGMLAAYKILLPKRLPLTDAYLNSVRAEGVDMFAAHLRTDKTDVSVCKLFALGADDFAAKLRAGEPS